MNGQPVWLASVSRQRTSGKSLYTPEWSESQFRAGEKILKEAMQGVGNESRERLFRMNVTLCLHRAATDEEVKAQGDKLINAPGIGLAGGPVEVLKETEPGSESTKPCHNPRKLFFDKSNPHAWIPRDCGQCPPCKGREAYG